MLPRGPRLRLEPLCSPFDKRASLEYPPEQAHCPVENFDDGLQTLHCRDWLRSIADIQSEHLLPRKLSGWTRLAPDHRRCSTFGSNAPHTCCLGLDCFLGVALEGIMTTTITASTQHEGATGRPRFYLWMASAMAATAFLGFVPTFWVPLAQGIPQRIGVLAIHGILFFGWTLLLIYQSWLAVSGKIARHRDIGMIGVSLATAMTIFGTLAAINATQRAIAANYADGGVAFMIVPMAAMLSFAVLVIAAIANVRRSDWHKRLLISATAVILDAAIARPFIAYLVMGGNIPPFEGTVGLAGLPGPPPPVAGVLPPALVAELFIVAGMVYDWRTRGKVHPAYLWAGGFALAVQLLKIPFSGTAAWHGMARWLISLAG